MTLRGGLGPRLAVMVIMVSVFAFFWPATPSIAKNAASEPKKALKSSPEKKVHKKRGAHKTRTAKDGRRSQSVEAKAVYCVDVKNKKILLARNADKSMPIASLTKLVTAMVALDRMPLDRKVKVPENISRVPKSVVGLKAGDSVTVGDLLHGLLIRSGNDCAETLACAYPGGRAAFIKAMNQKVRRMGAKHTVFYTPSGLDSKVGGTTKDKKSVRVRSNVSTAREMALIARTAFSNNTIRSISRKKSHVIASNKRKQGYRVSTTNKLLRSGLPVVGGKTGYTNLAGHCLASAFTPAGRVLLIVVLGSPDQFRDTRLVYRNALKKAKTYDEGGTRQAKPYVRSPKLAFHHK
ncbi:MAG: serine hydrolase [Pseudomonadota bacterium]